MHVSIANRSLVLCNGLVCRDHVAGSMDDVEFDYGRFPHRQALFVAAGNRYILCLSLVPCRRMPSGPKSFT